MSELVKKLRDLGDHASYEPHMHHIAADRIEALMERLAASFDLERAHIEVRKDVRTQANYIKALESALKDVSKHIWRGDFHQLDQSTRETLDYLGVKEEPKPTAIAAWKCPINHPDCKKNCGSYGCGN